jgi:hypothetical protein
MDLDLRKICYFMADVSAWQTANANAVVVMARGDPRRHRLRSRLYRGGLLHIAF